jgi:alpha-1,2-mannosyltransferase
MTLPRSILSGAWLHADRIRAGTRVLLAVEILAFIVLVLGTNGFIVPLDQPGTTDYVSFYAAGVLAMNGTPAMAYDQDIHFAMEQLVTAPGIGYQYFFYPPVYLLLCAPLSLPPYLVSFVAFQAVTLAFFLAVMRAILSTPDSGTGQPPQGWMIAVLAFPSVFWTLGLGQNSFLTAGLLGLGMLLLPRRPFLAGLLLGAMCYKPHFGLLLPLALLLGGQWRAIAGAAACVLLLAGLSVLLFGVETWQAYLLAMQGARAVYESGRIDFIGMATPFGGALLMGFSPIVAHAVQLLAMAATAAAVGWLWWRGASLPVCAAAVAAGSLLAVHLALVYDGMLLVLAMAWLVRAGLLRGTLSGERTIFLAVYLILLVVTKWLVLRGATPPPPIPLMPLASLAILALCLRRGRAELRAVGTP